MRLSNTLGVLGVRVALTCFAWLLSLLHGQAQLQFVLTRAELAAGDSLDWSNLGDPGTTVASPFSIQSSVGGLQLHVSQPSAAFEVYSQDTLSSSAGGWHGSFAPGDPVLYTGIGVGPVTIQFDSPVARVGAQIESGASGPFDATIEVFDSTGIVLGSTTQPGTSSSVTLADNSAIFLGVLSVSANISKLVFSVITATTYDFGMNQLSLSTAPATIVPEPAFGWVLLAGCALLGFNFRRR